MTTTPAPAARPAWGQDLGIGVGLALVVAVIVLAFSWPAVTADPRGVPVVVTGPALVRDQSSFPHASTTAPWLVLTGWTVLGLALAALGHRRASSAPRPGPQETREPVAVPA